jgi:hydrogenase expression/formation protein HypC
MCLGIPGRIVELDPSDSAALVEVSGVRRRVNVALLQGQPLAPDDWVLIHVGFALSVIDAGEAEYALGLLRAMGSAWDDEMAALERAEQA